MDIRKLQRAIVDGLEDVKAQNIVVFNTEHLSALFERVIIASGTSNRQTKSLAASVRDAVKAAGHPVPRVEGEANGEWIIVDCGAAVVHVMQPTFRDYYHLEELWGDKPVKMKLDSGAAPSLRTSGPDRPVRPPATAAQKVAADGPAAKKRTGAKKTAPGKPTAAGKSVAGRSTPAKSAPARSGARTAAKRAPGAPRNAVTRTVGVKRPAAKTAGGTARTTRPAGSGAAKTTSAAKKAAPRKTTARH